MQAAQWVIAAITATIVAGVAYLQWRTAQQKAVLDLFDRRGAIYEIVRKTVETMTQNSNSFGQPGENELMQMMEDAYFFFGDDVVGYLDRLWKAIWEMREADNTMKQSPSLTALGKLPALRTAALKRVTAFHTEGKPLFARYMRFAQTVPTR